MFATCSNARKVEFIMHFSKCEARHSANISEFFKIILVGISVF